MHMHEHMRMRKSLSMCRHILSHLPPLFPSSLLSDSWPPGGELLCSAHALSTSTSLNPEPEHNKPFRFQPLMPGILSKILTHVPCRVPSRLFL